MPLAPHENQSGAAPAAPTAEPKPRSEKQQIASRLNGARSSGPVTLLGKKHSSINAKKHGARATRASLDPLQRGELDELTQELDQALVPCGPLEYECVHSIAFSAFTCRLIRAAQGSLMSINIDTDTTREEALVTGLHETLALFRRIVEPFNGRQALQVNELESEAVRGVVTNLAEKIRALPTILSQKDRTWFLNRSALNAEQREDLAWIPRLKKLEPFSEKRVRKLFANPIKAKHHGVWCDFLARAIRLLESSLAEVERMLAARQTEIDQGGAKPLMSKLEELAKLAQYYSQHKRHIGREFRLLQELQEARRDPRLKLPSAIVPEGDLDALIAETSRRPPQPGDILGNPSTAPA